MTCVIAYNDGKEMHMVSDNATIDPYDNKYHVKSEKIFNNNEVLIGFTSSYRLGQLLHYKLKLPKIKRNQILQDYMIDLSETIREMYKKYNYEFKTNDGMPSCGDALFCINDKIFKLQSDYSMLEITDSFSIVGCGERYAQGALNILENSKIKNIFSVEQKLKYALETVSYFSAGVEPPYFYINKNMKEPKLL